MSVVAFTSMDALTWTFASVVVNASWTKPAVHYPPYRYNPSLPPEVWPPQIFKYWGPTEHDLETLSVRAENARAFSFQICPDRPWMTWGKRCCIRRITGP
jgi:hypothetical protein